MAALANQTFMNFDVWIVYDQSMVVAEETAELIRLLSVSHDVWELKGTGEGQVYAHNMVLWRTKSPYILRLDDDVLLCKDALQLLVEHLEKHDKAGAVGGLWFAEDKKRNTFGNKDELLKVLAIEEGNAAQQMNYHPTDDPLEAEHLYSTCLYRTEAMRKVGGWPLCYTRNLHHREESDGTARLRAAGWKLFILPNVRGIHLWAPGGVRQDASIAQGYGEKRKADDKTFYGERLPSVPALIKPKTVTAYSEHTIHIAGGERHFYATLAALCKADDLEVWGTHVIGHRSPEDIQKYFGFDISGVKGFRRRDNWAAGELDLGVIVSHAMMDQFPAKDYLGMVLFPMQRRNLHKFSRLYGNSRYTAWHINKFWGREAGVIYPPPNRFNYKPRSKKNRILLVGWFSRDKGHGEAVKAFKEAKLKGWKLTLVGWPGDAAYMYQLHRFIGDDKNIEVLGEVDNKTFQKLMQSSRILLGMRGINTRDPKHQEHFGLSVPEALSAGTIPVLYRSGGYMEVYPRFTFESLEELTNLLKQMSQWPKARWKAEAELAVARAADFGFERYSDEVLAATYEALRAGPSKDVPYTVGELAQEPDVAFVIPNYKQNDYLPDSIGSALASTYRDTEIIIVDDGSPDESSNAHLYHSAKVKMLRQRNKGVSAARNAAIGATKASLFLPLDADDFILPDTLRKLREANDGSVITYGNCVLQMSDGGLKHIPLPAWDYQKLLEKDIMPQSCLVPVEAWRAAGGYKDMAGYEDWEFWVSTTEQGYLGKHVDIDSYVYRVRDEEARHIDADELDVELRQQIRELHPNAYKRRAVAPIAEAQRSPAWLEVKPRELAEVPGEPATIEVIYEGPDEAPFHIRGEESGKVHRVEKDKPFQMAAVDRKFIEAVMGFKVLA